MIEIAILIVTALVWFLIGFHVGRASAFHSISKQWGRPKEWIEK